jgi:hypothetical protein
VLVQQGGGCGILAQLKRVQDAGQQAGTLWRGDHRQEALLALSLGEDMAAWTLRRRGDQGALQPDGLQPAAGIGPGQVFVQRQPNPRRSRIGQAEGEFRPKGPKIARAADDANIVHADTRQNLCRVGAAHAKRDAFPRNLAPEGDGTLGNFQLAVAGGLGTETDRDNGPLQLLDQRQSLAEIQLFVQIVGAADDGRIGLVLGPVFGACGAAEADLAQRREFQLLDDGVINDDVAGVDPGVLEKLKRIRELDDGPRPVGLDQGAAIENQ